MRVCPFEDCHKQISHTMFACLKHWRSMSYADRASIHVAYREYLAGIINGCELQEIQDDIMKSYNVG